VKNRLVAGGGAFLREETEVGAALPLDGAGVGPLLAEDEAEERGLAGAVGADEAEPVGARDEERDVGKQFAGAVGLGNVGESKHRNRTEDREKSGASTAGFATRPSSHGLRVKLPLRLVFQVRREKRRRGGAMATWRAMRRGSGGTPEPARGTRALPGPGRRCAVGAEMQAGMKRGRFSREM